MKNKARLADTAKNFVIILLFLSAVYLLFKVTSNEQGSFLSGLDELFSGSGSSETLAPSNGGDTNHAADPVYLMITTAGTTAADSSHYAVKYDGQGKEKIITQFSVYLGEALGSSGSLEEVSVEQWRTALSGTGVFFDYLYPQPLSSIASWLGYEASGETSLKSARRFFLGSRGESLALYFIDADDGTIYSCKTTFKFTSLESKIAEFPVGNAKFAFELSELGDDYGKIDPYFIFSYESNKLREFTVSNPVREGLDKTALLGYFGMNNKIVNDYSETDGSVVYVEGEKTLRFDASGRVLFTASGNSGIPIGGNPGTLKITELISVCYDIVQNSVGLTVGDGEIGLTGVSSVTDPLNCTLSFGYFADGVPVILPGGGDAAFFEISEGALVRAELYFRRYTSSGETMLALPERQATEIAKVSGGEPVLVYEDKLESVGCTWIFNN